MDEEIKKVLVLGSEGLVGSAIRRSKSLNRKYDIHYSNRNEADLTIYKEVQSLFSTVNPDITINCAGKVGGIVANSTERYEFLSQNIKINLNIFETVKNLNKMLLLNLGSSAIYPKNSQIPIIEEALMTGELEQSNSPYSLSKIVGIELGKAIQNDSISTINIIPTNLYGPNDNFNPISSHVVPGLISKIHSAKLSNKNEHMVWGSGKPIRELLYVDDLIHAIDVILEHPNKFETVNVGSNDEVTIKALANLIKDLVGFKGKIVFDKTKPDGVSKKTLNSDRIRSLGWQPSTQLKDGLFETYRWYVENST